MAGRDQVEAAWQARGGLVTDALLELGVCTETQFLRYFAVKYATRFITAARLAPTRVPDDVRDRVPVRLAETLGVAPLFYDPRQDILSVAAAVPLTPARLTAVRRAAGVDHLEFYVVTWAAVRAAIRKHYYSDPDAFADIGPGGFGPPPAADARGAGPRAPHREDPGPLRVGPRHAPGPASGERPLPHRPGLPPAGAHRRRPQAPARPHPGGGHRPLRLGHGGHPPGDGELAAKSRLPNPDVHIPSSLVARALKTPEGLLRTGIPAVPAGDTSKSVVARGVKSALVMPLRSADATLGILYLESLSSPDAFDENDRALLEAVSAQAATVIHNAQLLHQARRDALARANLSRFLPPELVEQAVAGSLDLRLEGQSAVVTVLYADIRGFTAATEAVGAGEVVRLLGRFYDEMTQAVFATGGMVDKFMGDGVMAVWGAPLAREDHAARALDAGADMVRRARGLELGGRPLPVAVGVATGEVVMGAIGSARRMDYTVIGPAVNIASRLCDTAGGGEVWLTEATRRAAGLADAATVDLGPKRLKGLAGPLTVHRLGRPDLPGDNSPVTPPVPGA